MLIHNNAESCYRIEDVERLNSPTLVVFRELVLENLAKTIEIAGNPARLRPHCKTHKMPRVIELQLEHGITKHKVATFAEAEMLAHCGVKDIFLAYNLVGPNVHRAVRFVETFPDVALTVTADDVKPLERLSQAMDAANQSIQVLLDVDTGLRRTGLPVGDAASELYRRIAELPGVEPGGLHIYDGQQKQPSLEERSEAIHAEFHRVLEFRDALLQAGYPVPRLVCGGTASFPVYAKIASPPLELSPGTSIFFDVGYGEAFEDLPFQPAGLVLTRVISRPAPDRITLDLGSKAVAADPPMGARVAFPDLPDAKLVLQNEEHLVVETAQAEHFEPGQALLGIPRHICPTSALYKSVPVVQSGRVVDEWEVTARDRRLTI